MEAWRGFVYIVAKRLYKYYLFVITVLLKEAVHVFLLREI